MKVETPLLLASNDNIAQSSSYQYRSSSSIAKGQVGGAASGRSKSPFEMMKGITVQLGDFNSQRYQGFKGTQMTKNRQALNAAIMGGKQNRAGTTRLHSALQATNFEVRGVGSDRSSSVNDRAASLSALNLQVN